MKNTMPKEIMEYASSRNAKDREKAIKKLKNLNLSTEEYNALLNNMLNVGSELARKTAIKAAPKLLQSDSQIKMYSRKALKDESWEVREGGAHILRYLKKLDGEALNLIESYSKDKNAIVNRTTGDSIANLYRKNIVSWDLIIKLVKSASRSQNKTAAFALRNIYRKNPSIIDKLIEWAKEGTDEMKYTAIYAMKLIGKREPAISKIIEGITGGEIVQKIKRKALKELSGGK